MNADQAQVDDDQTLMNTWLEQVPDTEKVAKFVPGPGIQRLKLKFNIDELQSALSSNGLKGTASPLASLHPD